jgi:hypothetical protein
MYVLVCPNQIIDYRKGLPAQELTLPIGIPLAKQFHVTLERTECSFMEIFHLFS